MLTYVSTSFFPSGSTAHILYISSFSSFGSVALHMCIFVYPLFDSLFLNANSILSCIVYSPSRFTLVIISYLPIFINARFTDQRVNLPPSEGARSVPLPYLDNWQYGRFSLKYFEMGRKPHLYYRFSVNKHIKKPLTVV